MISDTWVSNLWFLFNWLAYLSICTIFFKKKNHKIITLNSVLLAPIIFNICSLIQFVPIVSWFVICASKCGFWLISGTRHLFQLSRTLLCTVNCFHLKFEFRIFNCDGQEKIQSKYLICIKWGLSIKWSFKM